MTQSLRELLRTQKPLVCPVAHDGLSARMIEMAGFKSFSVGGSALLAARYALPDLGLAGLGEMVGGIRDIVEASCLPCLVDGDDGYGDVKSVARMVEIYEGMGVAGLLLEDQGREGKQPGAAAARCVIPLDVMERKLAAAMAARKDKEFAIIGRTDSLGTDGLDEALRRADKFLKLGADGIFIAGLQTVQQYERVGRTFKGTWNSATIFQGRQTPWLAPKDLYEMGFSQVDYPNILIGRVAQALKQGLTRLQSLTQGDAFAFKNSEDELSLDALSEAVQLERWKAIERSFGESAPSRLA